MEWGGPGPNGSLCPLHCSPEVVPRLMNFPTRIGGRVFAVGRVALANDW